MIAVGIAVFSLRSLAPVDASTPELSLLAVGDTGVRGDWLKRIGRQVAVGEALAREDRRSPVDALLLLGDNFYDNGLHERELASRVRTNVVVPYCRFVDLSGPRSAEVRGTCTEGQGGRTRPIFAVLGNHDVESEESRALQSREVVRFVANWDLSDEPARWVALSPKVSLILFDSNRMLRGEGVEPLREAIRAAPGPWRILVAHHPIGTRSKKGHEPKGQGADDHRRKYDRAVREAVRGAGVPVHLMLAGHEHNLQVLALDDPGPRLVVVSGAGSRPREVQTQSDSRLYSHDELGFVRVDLLTEGDGERLRVTLFDASHWPSLLGFPPEVLGRWSLGSDGTLAVEPLAIRLVEAR